MDSTDKNCRFQLSNKTLGLPVITIAVFIFGFADKEFMKSKSPDLSLKAQTQNLLQIPTIDTPKITQDNTPVFEKMEYEPEIPKLWYEFLEQNIKISSLAHDVQPGIYTTIIQFIVEPTGELSSFKPFTNYGFNIEEEVIRIMKMSEKWKAGMQNGRLIRAFRRQPLTFIITRDGSDDKSNLPRHGVPLLKPKGILNEIVFVGQAKEK